ncbi:MAG: hypothetical protein AABX79_03320 [Nanoarchaeota archaeon]
MNGSNLFPSKSFLFLAIFLILILPKISAVETDMKSQFSQGETLLARISGNFIDQITSSNVLFYRNTVKIPVIYDVVKIDDEFYIYALLPGESQAQTQGNYSLYIGGIRYYKATQIVDDNIVLNFTISNETAIFSVNPGVVSTKGDFSAEIQNLQDRKITIGISDDSPFMASPAPFELKSGEKKNLSFSVSENSETGLVEIWFSSENFSYLLPVYLNTGKTAEEKKADLEFKPSAVEISIATDSNSKKILYLTNTGDEPLENIILDVSPLLDPYITISPGEIDSLDANSTEQIEIQISSGQQEAVLEGKIIAHTGNMSAPLTLVLDFVKDYIPPAGEENITIVTTCDELGGKICAENTECTGESVYAKDGVCCLSPSECAESGGSGSAKKWIGWSLLVVAVIFIYWFYKNKYKRVAPKKPF